MNHELSLWKILTIFLYGIEQKIRWWLPDWIAKPDVQPISAPSWWSKFKTWEQWYYSLDENRRPREAWFTHYFDCAWSWQGHWIEEVGDWAWDKAVGIVRAFTGFVDGGFGTFQNWIRWLVRITGDFVPWWVDNLSHGVSMLYDWLPQEIKSWSKTWSQLFDAIVGRAIEWAQNAYDDVRGWYEGARQILENRVDQLRSWWLGARQFLDEFRQNYRALIQEWLGAAWRFLVGMYEDPYGTITHILGDAWHELYTFWRDCLHFWYDVWGWHATFILEFFAAPLFWLYDRVEDFLCDRW